jgi:hypothetical protein
MQRPGIRFRLVVKFAKLLGVPIDYYQKPDYSHYNDAGKTLAKDQHFKIATAIGNALMETDDVV